LASRAIAATTTNRLSNSENLGLFLLLTKLSIAVVDVCSGQERIQVWMMGGVTGGLETEVPHRGSEAELLVGDWGLRPQKLTYIFVFKMNLLLKK
jgi:hypothetical protein